MLYRTFGRTGLEVSEVGFGAWQIGGDWGKIDDKQSIDTLHYAFDKCINFVDTAVGRPLPCRTGRSARSPTRDRVDRRRDTIRRPPAPQGRGQDQFAAIGEAGTDPRWDMIGPQGLPLQVKKVRRAFCRRVAIPVDRGILPSLRGAG